MKKILPYLLIIAVGLSSCKKDDNPAFDKSPEQRINEALSAYQTKLVGAANGWKALIYPKGGGAYFFYFKFNDQNRVKMYSTFDSASAVAPMESSYRLKALQQPSLIFDTYSYVHVLADPNENVTILANVNGGPVGVGLQSDFEFYFDSTAGDTLKLVGRFNGSKADLIPATKQEADAFDNKQLATGFLLRNLGRYLEYFKRVTIGGVVYEINASQSNRVITFTWLDANGNAQTFSTPFYYSGTGVNFINPLINGSQTISGLTNLTWNAATTTLGFTVNGTQVTINGFGQPLKVDLTAPQRFKQFAISGGNMWLSGDGWHVNGVDDALNLSGLLPNYAAAMYAPKEVAQYGWSQGDLGGVLLDGGNSLRASSYTSAISNGIIKFAIQGTNTTIGFGATLTTAQRNLVVAPTNSFRSFMTDPTGYYLVQTSPLSYDMVRASDGKAWITWEWIW